MTNFLLLRHAQPDYREIDIRKYRAFGNDLAPLTEDGIIEAKEVAHDELLEDADLIITSPYTRTIQTAAIISKELNLDFKVELDLMEWIPDKTYMYTEYSDVVRWREHYDENNGKNKYPEDNFEEKEEIQKRVKNVLNKYTKYKKVIVITHGMVINALTDTVKPKTTQIVPFSI